MKEVIIHASKSGSFSQWNTLFQFSVFFKQFVYKTFSYQAGRWNPITFTFSLHVVFITEQENLLPHDNSKSTINLQFPRTCKQGAQARQAGNSFQHCKKGKLKHVPGKGQVRNWIQRWTQVLRLPREDLNPIACTCHNSYDWMLLHTKGRC